MKYISLFFWFAYFVSMVSHKSRESKAIHHFLKHPCQLYLICQMQHNPTSEDNTNHSVLYVVAMPMNVWGCIRDRYAPVEVGGQGGHRVGTGWAWDDDPIQTPDSNLSYTEPTHAPRLLSILIQYPSLVSFSA